MLVSNVKMWTRNLQVPKTQFALLFQPTTILSTDTEMEKVPYSIRRSTRSSIDSSADSNRNRAQRDTSIVPLSFSSRSTSPAPFIIRSFQVTRPLSFSRPESALQPLSFSVGDQEDDDDDESADENGDDEDDDESADENGGDDEAVDLGVLDQFPVWSSRHPQLQQMDCAICMESVGNGRALITLQCFHIFHWACLEQSFAVDPLCPLCRRSIAD